MTEEVEYTETDDAPVQEEVEVKEAKDSQEAIAKKDRWKFIKVVWGKAQDIGANINKIIDGITVDDDETDDEE